jgi:stage II sporulation protein D
MAALNGKTGIFCSRYSACIGGKSQDPFEAWGDPPLPALSARDTGPVDDNSDKFNWDRDFVVSKVDATRCIQSWGERNHFDALAALARGGRIESIAVNKRNAATGRPAELLLTDSAGRKALMRAEEFRISLLTDPAGRAPKLYSSNCDIRVQGDAFVMYNGHGYGHGIGMSQWGAQNLAKKGWNEARILAFFYPGAKLEELW